VELVAVCDPVKEHADGYAADLGGKIRTYYDIHDLVKDGGIEAAIVVAPIPLHHAYSVYLSEHKIHNLIETSWCNTLSQARDMIAAAKRNNVYTRVAENFFRYPIDRFAQTLQSSGYIGEIKRIFCYNDHTGYHNNSRWLVFHRGDALLDQFRPSTT
jgi:predicted dehydrogenase